MLEILFNWLMCLVVVLPLGRSILFRIGKIMGGGTQFSDWVNFWVGLAGISLVLNLLSFGIALHPINKAFLWLFLGWAALSQRNYLKELYFLPRRVWGKWHWASLSLGIFSTFIALLKAGGVPEIFDEGAYHLPLIRMWERQGLVPGMANLNGHYGLNSTWHLLSAWANIDFLPFFHSVFALNGLAMVVLGWFAASRMERILRGPALLADWIIIFLPFMVFRNLISSPSTDIPAIICSWFIYTLWLEAIEKEESPLTIWPVLTILPFWAVLLKASSAPLLLIPSGMVIICFVNGIKKNSLIVMVVGSLLILPWLLQNWFLTGYGVFPVKATALGNPIWQVPIESINNKFYLAQFGAFAPPEQYNWLWLKTWFSAHNRDTQVILICCLSSLVAGFVFLFRRDSERVWVKVYLYMVVLACLLTWLLTITEPRYGFGALVFSALLPIAFFLRLLSNQQKHLPKLAFLALFALIINVFKTAREYKFDGTALLFPKDRPTVATRNLSCINFEAVTPVVYTSQVPDGKPVFCWDCPFPCVPKEGISDSSHLEMIGVGPYLGFRYQRSNYKDQ